MHAFSIISTYFWKYWIHKLKDDNTAHRAIWRPKLYPGPLGDKQRWLEPVFPKRINANSHFRLHPPPWGSQVGYVLSVESRSRVKESEPLVVTGWSKSLSLKCRDGQRPTPLYNKLFRKPWRGFRMLWNTQQVWMCKTNEFSSVAFIFTPSQVVNCTVLVSSCLAYATRIN